MHVPTRPLAGLPVFLLAVAGLAAQTPGGETTSESWAAEPRPVAVGRTPGQVRVFEEEEIHRSGARTLGEFLIQQLPGQIQNQGGPGLPSRAYLGGSRPQDTTVLVDGVPRMDPGRLGQDLNEIPLLGIRRIEVLVGTAGAGPSGPGATIALFTGRPGKPGLSGDLSGLGGNNGQGRGELSSGYVWDGGHLQGGNLSAEQQQTTDTARPFRMVTNFLDLGQQWGAARWTLGWRSTAFGVPEPYQEVTDATRTYDPTRESRQRSDAGQLRLDWGLAPGLRLESALALARYRHEQPAAGTADPSAFEGRLATLHAALLFATGPRSDLSLRLEGQDARQQGDEVLAIQGAAEGRGTALGLTWRFEPHPGLRLIGEARGTRDRQTLESGPVRREVLSASGHALRLGANQELPYGFRLYAGLGSSRTPPLLVQQLRNTLVAGAEPLRMERSTTLQVGLGWGHGAWYGKLESQQQSGRDLIAFDGQGYVNQDRVRVRSTEGSFGWRAARNSGVEGFLRAQEARDLRAPDDQAFGTLASQRRPFHTHGLRGFVGWGQVRAEVHYTLQGRQYAAAGDGDTRGGAATNGLPPLVRPTRVVYRTVGLSTSVTAGPHWTFILRGENLLQPKVTPAEWTGGTLIGQNDASVIDGYPAARPSYALEGRFRF